MPTRGDFSRLFVNGLELTADATQIQYGHVYDANPVQAQNVGIKQYAPGAFNPTYALQNLYARHGQGGLTAHNLFKDSGIGNTNDIEMLCSQLLGNSASPQAGDLGVIYDGTLIDYKRQDPATGIMTAGVNFRPRNTRNPLFPVLLYDNTAIKTASSFNTTPIDDGAESAAGTAQGAVAVLQVYSPTGVAATGTISLTGQPADGDSFTLTIGGTAYVYTFKTTLTPTAGQVLIGTTAAATALNLYAAIIGSQSVAGTAYAVGTVPIPQAPLSTALVFVSAPNSSNVINLTAAQTGTTANAYTLVKSGVNLAVSGATMAGGVAGDTYNIAVASSTSSGGSYTTHATFSGVGATRQAQRIEIGIGAATINEWLRLTVSLASGAGTSQTFAANVLFGRYWQQ